MPPGHHRHAAALSLLGVADVVSAGQAIARLVAGSWREAPRPLVVDAGELATLSPLLIRGGVAALVWRRIAASATTPPAPAAAELRSAQQLQSLRAELHAQRVAAAFSAMRAAGVAPILGKGWAAARRYPDPALRPYGDVDLWVRDADYARAVAVVRAGDLPIDLHRGFAPIGDDAEIARRATPVALDGVEVHLFGDEDHLRLLALHLLRHGAYRPLWLCDVAVAVEGAAAGFDWDYLVTRDRMRANWIGTVLALAESLLDMRATAPRACLPPRTPRWLVPAVLRQWSDARFVPQGQRRAMADVWREPRAIVPALRQRWPNAIEATVGVEASFDETPRLPLQLAECARRVVGYLRQ